jgi:transposase
MRHGDRCVSCEDLRARLATVEQRRGELETENEQLRVELREATDLIELQKGDIGRYRAAFEQVRPNTPERVSKDQLQLAFARILESCSDVPAAQTLAANQNREQGEEKKANGAPAAPGKSKKGFTPHGRRKLDLTALPVEECVIDPEEVASCGGQGYELIGQEESDRVAFRPGSYVRLRIVRRKWVPKRGVQGPRAREGGSDPPGGSPVKIAPLPGSVWPSCMADPSTVAEHIVAKYADVLPLHRQEVISARNGFRVPRSTQCSWLGQAFAVLYRIVEAMHAEAVARAFCIATDATGAPVRLLGGGCDNWHVFVLIADHDHVVFRYTAEHTSEAVDGLLHGFRGYLLADAAAVYDILHRGGAIEVGCWAHLRRYFWRAIPSEPQRALEAMALIAKLFAIERGCRTLPLPEHTERRAREAQPVLALLDAWVDRNRNQVDPRSPLHRAIGYYDNQREGLHRFLDDGRLRLDNGVSEQQLRNLVLGRHNWMYFENETGLKWYTTFRSLIASCALQGINPRQYMEQVLRLAPHWRVSRMLELSPKYWQSTLSRLSPEQARFLIPPWQTEWPRVSTASSPADERRCA